MDAATTIKKSKRFSWLLRHGAGREGLEMDEAGWVAIEDVRAALRISRNGLDAVVAQNDKTRFEISGDRIRASQGHSLETMPVSLDALEASWSRYTSSRSSIWHGTNVDAIAGIAKEGIHRGRRTHVHLAASPDAKVGKRSNVHVLMEICPDLLESHGQGVFVSSNGVVLVRHVPVDCVVGIRTLTRRARVARPTLVQLLTDASANFRT